MSDVSAAKAAAWFLSQGFSAFPVWGVTDTGSCLCPKASACTNPGKHPASEHGFQNATQDVEAVKRFLANPGTPNYGLVPPDGVIAVDVDTEAGKLRWDELQGRYGPLPATLTTTTANGWHFFFSVETIGKGKLFGFVVRSKAKGYVIGPGSHHASGVTYGMHGGKTGIQRLPETWEQGWERETPTSTIRVGGLRPEDVEVGGRHDFLRDRARTLRGAGLVGEDLFAAVWALNLRLSVPKTDEEVRRAIGDVETKFEADPAPITLDVPRAGEPKVDVDALEMAALIVPVSDYHAANATIPVYISPLAAYGMVSLVSGPPKGGKSTLISNLLQARETNSVFLWGDPVPIGPALLVTEEGGYPVVRKTQGMVMLDVLDRMAFAVAGLRSLDHLLAVMTRWVEWPSLVVIDTLAVWGDIKDENDAIAATKAIVALRVWAQHYGCAVVLVHHTRKGGGDHGEAIRGSGGIFAAVDQSVELAFTKDPLSDDRTLVIAGRLAFGETKTLAFDRTDMTYSVTTRVIVEKYPTDQFPLDGTGVPGFTNVEAGSVWGLAPNTAGNRLRDLVAAGTLVSRDERLAGARATHKAYWRARPLLVLDTRSVSEQMADIFAKPESEE